MEIETEKKLKEARRLYDQADFKGCIDALKGIKADKRTVELVGRSYFQLSEIEKGKEVFEVALKNIKSDQIDSIDMINIILYIAQMNYEDELYLRVQLLPILKTNYDYYQKNNQEQDPQRKKGILLWAKGTALFQREINDYKQSVELLKESLEYLDDYQQEILTFISFVYLSVDKIKEAIEYNNKVILINDRNFEAIANQGYCLATQNDLEGAMKLYKKAEVLCPNNIVNLSNISIQLDKENSNELISKIYANKIITLQPKCSKGYIRLARVNSIHKKEEQNLPMLKYALPICTDFGIARELFRIYKQKYLIEEFQSLIETSIIQFPENKGDILFEEGDYFMSEQEYEKAQEKLKESLLYPSQLYPFSIHIRLAYCSFALEDLEGVIKNAKLFLNHPLVSFISEDDIKNFAYILGASRAGSDEDRRYFFKYFQDHPKFLPFLSSQESQKEFEWFPNIFKTNLDLFRNQLHVMVFNEVISDELVFKPYATLWDLYID